MKEFKLRQAGTSVPAENVQDVKVTLLDSGELFIHTKWGWVYIDLTDETFAVGDYEG